MVSLGARIKLMRSIRNLSQAALGKAAGGIQQYDISSYENGRSLPTDETIASIEQALGVNFDYPIVIQPDGRLECSPPETKKV